MQPLCCMQFSIVFITLGNIAILHGFVTISNSVEDVHFYFHSDERYCITTEFYLFY